jgi:hypothetical protein
MPVRAFLWHDLVQIMDNLTVLGVPAWDALGICSAEDVRLQFVRQLRVFTGGIPRFVCLTLEALLAHKPALRSASDVHAAFVPGSAVVAKVLENHTFVQGGIEPLKGALLATGGNSNDATLEILEVLLAVASGLTFPHSGDSDKVLAAVDRLGAYMDGDVVNGKNVFRVMLPEVLRLALMASPGVQQGLDRTVGMLKVVLARRTSSAGAIGDRLEAVVAVFFKTQLYLSWFFGAPVSRVGRLLKLLGLQHAPLDFRQSLVKVDESSLGKLLRLKEEPTPQTVDSVMPRVFTGAAVRGQCVMLLPFAQSHSADLFVSLPFLDGTHALLLVSCKATNSKPVSGKATDSKPVSGKATNSKPVSGKATNSKPVSSDVVAAEVAKATNSEPVSSDVVAAEVAKATNSEPVSSDVVAAEVAKATVGVAALPSDARALYGDRIFLLFLEHPQASVKVTTLTPHPDAGFTEVHLDAGTTAELLGGAFLTPEQIQAAVGALKPKLKVGCRTAQQRYRG